ncbi:MAG: hypothetical protein GY788_21750 [bacterium]|nr:hypothetical protein [bacterium]
MSLARRLLAVAAASAVMVVGLVSVAAAQDADEPPKNVSVEVGETKTDTEPAEAEGAFELPDDWEPTAEELAEINAETDDLVEYLKGKGFGVTVETDELGFTYVDFDENSDEALFEAMDEFYAERFAAEVASWSDEDKAEFNKWTDEFIAELAEQGITAEKEEIAPGVYDLVWTEELDQALMELDGDLFFGDDEGWEDDWEITEEMLAELNAETDALVEYLADLGHEVTVTTDDDGFKYVDFDESTDEAIFEAVDAFYQERFVAEVATWSDAEKGEWNEGIDEFVAELAAEGIPAETEEIAPGVFDIVWTEELEEALCDLDGDELIFGDEVPEEDAA